MIILKGELKLITSEYWIVLVNNSLIKTVIISEIVGVFFKFLVYRKPNYGKRFTEII